MTKEHSTCFSEIHKSIASARRIVVKIGTNALMSGERPHKNLMYSSIAA